MQCKTCPRKETTRPRKETTVSRYDFNQSYLRTAERSTPPACGEMQIRKDVKMTKTKLYAGISIVGILAAASTAGAAYKEIQRDQACKYKDYFAAHEAECEGRVFLSPFSNHKH